MSFEERTKNIIPILKRITYKLRYGAGYLDDNDLFQEALLHLWQDYNSGKLLDKTDSYILQGCYFHLKNYLRKIRKKARFLNLEALAESEKENSLKEITAIQEAGYREYLDYLHDKLLVETICNNGFTPREKTLLFFCKEGLTTRQIGERMGVTHVSIVKMISKIKVKCAQYQDKVS